MWINLIQEQCFYEITVTAARTFFTRLGFFMRRHFLMSISVVFTHPGWRKTNTHFFNMPNRAVERWRGHSRWMEEEVGGGNLPCTDRGLLTTGRWTSQKALSWLSRIFLSVLSFFLSILHTRSVGERNVDGSQAAEWSEDKERISICVCATERIAIWKRLN